MICSGPLRKNRDRKKARVVRDFHNFHGKNFVGKFSGPEKFIPEISSSEKF